MFNIKNSTLIIVCIFLFAGKGFTQDFNQMKNDAKMYGSSRATKIYVSDGAALNQSFGERKNTRPIVISFPLVEPKDEKATFRFTSEQIKGTAVRGVESSSIKKIFLGDLGFEITFDPTGKTGPIDALILIETEGGVVRLKMTGTLTGTESK